MKSLRLCSIPGLGLLAFVASHALGQGTATTYQGQLMSSGAPAHGSFDFVFRLCSGAAPEGGVLDVLETFPPTGTVAVEVVNGLFTQELIFTPSLFTGEERWLEIEVGGTTLSPRQHLTYTPYATVAGELILPFSGTGNVLMPGCVFSITSTGAVPAICGDNTAPSGATCGVSGTAASSDGTGVCGRAVNGVRGESTTANGNGVVGYASGGPDAWAVGGETATGQAVIGRAGTSPPGGGFPPVTGVVGYSNGTSGTGVFGQAASTTGLTLGGYFTNSSNAGTAVRGDATSFVGETYGGSFFSAGNLGTGVKGSASSPTGITFGGKFENESTDGIGVQGKANALTGFTYGGRFECRSATIGIGVLGYATSPTGVTYGVYGRTLSSDPNAYGVWSLGRLGASGTKSFRIDHPLDPTEKYLMHYTTEGPEPQNVYNGTIVTDVNGYAWVQLPDYFGEINTNPRYQLTVVDDSSDFVMAKVTQEIAGNQFQIRTSKPNVKVCWEIKATRNDLYVRTYGAPVETQKAEGERGGYLHPELYGIPGDDGASQGKER